LVFFLPIAVGTVFSAWGKNRNCQRMNYSPKTTPQIEETVRKVDTTCLLVETNGPFFGIRHP
jgi:DNA-binding transcriptional MocR family regulator